MFKMIPPLFYHVRNSRRCRLTDAITKLSTRQDGYPPTTGDARVTQNLAGD